MALSENYCIDIQITEVSKNESEKNVDGLPIYRCFLEQFHLRATLFYMQQDVLRNLIGDRNQNGSKQNISCSHLPSKFND